MLIGVNVMLHFTHLSFHFVPGAFFFRMASASFSCPCSSASLAACSRQAWLSHSLTRCIRLRSFFSPFFKPVAPHRHTHIYVCISASPRAVICFLFPRALTWVAPEHIVVQILHQRRLLASVTRSNRRVQAIQEGTDINLDGRKSI